MSACAPCALLCHGAARIVVLQEAAQPKVHVVDAEDDARLDGAVHHTEADHHARRHGRKQQEHREEVGEGAEEDERASQVLPPLLKVVAAAAREHTIVLSRRVLRPTKDMNLPKQNKMTPVWMTLFTTLKPITMRGHTGANSKSTVRR